MIEYIRMIGVWFIWFSMMWVVGVGLHLGYKGNPRQPHISIGRHLTKFMTLGAVEGEVAIVPALVQLDNLFFLNTEGLINRSVRV